MAARRAVERFHLPGIVAMNRLLRGALAGGGGPASPRLDPLGHGFAQVPPDLPMPVAWEL